MTNFCKMKKLRKNHLKVILMMRTMRHFDDSKFFKPQKFINKEHNLIRMNRPYLVECQKNKELEN